MSTKQYERGSGKTGRIHADGAGRPTEFKEEYIEAVRKLCKLGATDMEIADFFGITWRTVYRWKNTQPEFAKAMEEGKEAADARVVRSLYQRAVGYEHDAVKIFLPRNSRKAVMVPYIEHVAPDVTAAQFWLKNRQKDQWRDRQNVEIGGDPDGVPIEHGVSAFAELARRITGLASADRTSSDNVADDGSTGGRTTD